MQVKPVTGQSKVCSAINRHGFNKVRLLIFSQCRSAAGRKAVTVSEKLTKRECRNENELKRTGEVNRAAEGWSEWLGMTTHRKLGSLDEG